MSSVLQWRRLISHLLPRGPSLSNSASASASALSSFSFSNPASPSSPQKVIRAPVPPLVLQHTPDGFEAIEGYDGGSYCGPACMAMVARALDLDSLETDAQLILRFAEVGKTTSFRGTETQNMVELARLLGLHLSVAHADVLWTKARLRTGHLVVVRGDFCAFPSRQDGTTQIDHYMLLYGLDDEDRFLVRDPADGELSAITTMYLMEFFRRESLGGWQMALKPTQNLGVLQPPPPPPLRPTP